VDSRLDADVPEEVEPTYRRLTMILVIPATGGDLLRLRWDRLR
jgi:hypothetical protein